MSIKVKKFYNIGKNQLYPICRSLTGEGVRKTLKIIKKNFPSLKIHEVISGKKVFDWKVPPEWNVKNAYVVDKYKNKIIDFRKNNLHLVGYSIPINKKISKSQFLEHLHSLPKQPLAIPYITSYYKKYWGFCVSHKEKLKIQKKYNKNDKFEVVIDSNFNIQGKLNYGELVIKGKSKQEILISTYICHPSMANNELSGPIVSMSLINYFIKSHELNQTLRFIFIPETIGSITYLSKNINYLKKNIIGGYNLSCIGDNRSHSCMMSKYQNSPSDEALIEAYKKLKIKKFKIYSFLERGSDERQYNSPGIDLPISSIFRTKYGKFPEYHTSLDDFNLVTIEGILGGFKIAKEAISVMQKNIYPKFNILCEPQMGKRGLYPTLSTKSKKKITKYFMDFLQYSDGKNSLFKISKLLKTNIKTVYKINKTFLLKKLITN